MAKKSHPDKQFEKTRYEYRVWGEHRKARKALSNLASEKTNEQFEDCYFIVDDPAWNAKIRDNSLKIKQLIAEERGFERWASNRPESAETTPAPFDELFEALGLDRAARGKSFNLSKAVAELDPDAAAKAVFVTKRRTRYRIGSMRAEVTDVTIDSTGEVLRTLAIEGDDLDELVALRKTLGLKGSENVAYHVAIDDDS